MAYERVTGQQESEAFRPETKIKSRYAISVPEISRDNRPDLKKCMFICSSAQRVENAGRFPSQMSVFHLLPICNIFSSVALLIRVGPKALDDRGHRGHRGNPC